MPIQFQCPACQSVIRTPDGSEGKQARCPKCSTVATIPGVPGRSAPAALASPAAPASPSFGGEPASNPFSAPPAPLGQPSNPGGFGFPSQPTGGFPPPSGYGAPAGGLPPASSFPPPPANPYMAPSYGGYGGGGGGGDARSKLKAPAIGLIVCAALSIAYSLVNAVTVIVQLSSGEMEVPPDGPERIGFIVGAIIGMIGVGVVPLISLFGAIQMLKGKSYGWAMTGAITGMLPCSACCLVGLIFGIWGIVVLNQPDVKQVFR